MKRHLGAAAHYAGSALLGLAGGVTVWVCLAGDAGGPAAVVLLAAGVLAAAGAGLRGWGGRYYFRGS